VKKGDFAECIQQNWVIFAECIQQNWMFSAECIQQKNRKKFVDVIIFP
jgi:hypothetical protein